MSSLLPTRRTLLRTGVAAFLAAAQFAVASFAPAVEGRAGAGAAAHVEDFGVHLHFAHNPDDCAACVAQSLVAILPPAAPLPADAAPAVTASRADDAAAPDRDGWRDDAARAPPAAHRARSLT